MRYRRRRCVCFFKRTAQIIESDQQAIPEFDNTSWQLILNRVKLGPNKKHYFQLEGPKDVAFTHIKVTIYPGAFLRTTKKNHIDPLPLRI